MYSVMKFTWPDGPASMALPAYSGKSVLILEQLEIEVSVSRGRIVCTLACTDSVAEVRAFMNRVPLGLEATDVQARDYQYSFFCVNCLGTNHHDALKNLMKRYLQLMTYFGIALASIPVPRIVTEYFYGPYHGSSTSVPLGEFLVKQWRVEHGGSS